MAYKLTKSMDGEYRVDLKVEFRFELREIAAYLEYDYGFTTYDTWEENDVEGAIAELRTKRDVMDKLKTALYFKGYDRLAYGAVDSNLHGQFLLEHIKTLWNE